MRGRVLLVATATIIGWTAGTDATHAATLGFKEDCCSATLIYTAAPGEVNRLAVSGQVVQSLGGGVPLITFRDPGNTITPDTGYDSASTSATLSNCTFTGDSATCQDNTSAWSVALGDGNDSITFAPPPSDSHGISTWPRQDTIVVQGGDGADTLRGGWSAGSFVRLEAGRGGDHLFGWGDDTMVGGPGADTMAPLAPVSSSPEGTVSYSSADTPQTGVTVTLDGVANDGAAGEGDNVDPGVAHVIGTGGDDRLTGNTMVGHELDGSGGNDRLDSGGGYGVLDGGSGNDAFVARDGVHQYIGCGPGTDGVLADLTDLVTADCELVSQR